jgi:hypothetical protein
MPGLGNIVTTKLITKGLSCEPACSGIITTHFSLLCTGEPVIEPEDETAGGGGGYEGPAWNVARHTPGFNTPVINPGLVPYNRGFDLFTKKVKVTLRINIGEVNKEFIYIVPKSFEGITVKVFNILDGFKLTARKIRVKIGNIFPGKIRVRASQIFRSKRNK